MTDKNDPTTVALRAMGLVENGDDFAEMAEQLPTDPEAREMFRTIVQVQNHKAIEGLAATVGSLQKSHYIVAIVVAAIVIFGTLRVAPEVLANPVEIASTGTTLLLTIAAIRKVLK